MNKDRTNKNKFFGSTFTHKGNIVTHVVMLIPMVLMYTHSYIAAPEQIKSSEVFALHITPWFALTFVKP